MDAASDPPSAARRSRGGYRAAVSTYGVRVLCCAAVETAARELRDAGHEVVVLDVAVSAEQLAAVAVQEDVTAVAVSDLELGAAAAGLLEEDVVVFSITSPAQASSAPESRD